MPQLLEQFKLDAKNYEHQVIEGHNSKSGWFIFDNSETSLTVNFKVDSNNGKFLSLSAVNEDDSEFVISEDNCKDFVDQILTEIGDDESYKNYTDHGMTNADFISDYA